MTRRNGTHHSHRFDAGRLMVEARSSAGPGDTGPGTQLPARKEQNTAMCYQTTTLIRRTYILACLCSSFAFIRCGRALTLLCPPALRSSGRAAVEPLWAPRRGAIQVPIRAKSIQSPFGRHVELEQKTTKSQRTAAEPRR